MKTKHDIQRAHDMLAAIALNEVRMKAPLSKKAKLTLEIQCSVLCWILEHEHNPAFGKLLDNINDAFAEAGIVEEIRISE